MRKQDNPLRNRAMLPEKKRSFRVIAGMATQPTRSHTAPLAIRRLLPQVDLLILHLDGFGWVPEWAIHPKILVDSFTDRSPLGAEGKLIAHEYGAPNDLILVVDDDVCLPRDIVGRIIKELDSLPGKSVVGVHGSVLRRDLTSYVRDREVTHLHQRLGNLKQVDVVSTCVAGYYRRNFNPNFRSWEHKNMVDLQFAIDAQVQNVSPWLLPRKKNWVRFYEEKQPDSIYLKLTEDDITQTVLARQLLERQSDYA